MGRGQASAVGIIFNFNALNRVISSKFSVVGDRISGVMQPNPISLNCPMKLKAHAAEKSISGIRDIIRMIWYRASTMKKIRIYVFI